MRAAWNPLPLNPLNCRAADVEMSCKILDAQSKTPASSDSLYFVPSLWHDNKTEEKVAFCIVSIFPIHAETTAGRISFCPIVTVNVFVRATAWSRGEPQQLRSNAGMSRRLFCPPTLVRDEWAGTSAGVPSYFAVHSKRHLSATSAGSTNIIK